MSEVFTDTYENETVTEPVEKNEIEVSSKKTVIVLDDEEIDMDMNIQFSHTYVFEGNNISGVDLSGLEDITANDMIRAVRQMTNSGSISIMPESDLEYLLIMAANAAKMPVEFFKGLRPVDALKVRNRVQLFFGRGE